MNRQRVFAIARRQRYVLQRSPHRSFDLTIWPLVDTLLFGSIAAFFAKQAGDVSASDRRVGYLLAGTVLWHVVYQAQIGLATGFLEETWSRNVLNLMVTPLSEIEYVAGVALFSLLKILCGVAVVAVTAFGFYSFDVTTLGLGIIPVVALLMVVGWVVALFVIGLVLRFGTGAEALAWGILFVVMPMSGVFYPVSALPGFLQPISALLPTTHAFAAGRSLVDGTGMDWHAMRLAAATTVLATAIGLWFVVRMLRVFRQRGYVTRFA